LFKIYSAADVAVWPKEASMSMMEAMACNRPIIISDDSEVEERLEYNNGLLYRANDPEDLSRKMEKLLDASLRDEIGQRGRKLIEDKLSWDIISRRFIEIVEGRRIAG
jgi:glycosyltransferase involved in cell wall biosynthesis